MPRYKKKVGRRKQSVIINFIPLLKSLEDQFGEERVVLRRLCLIRDSDPSLSLTLKGYNRSVGAYVLQAKKNGYMQYFDIRIEEGELSRLERFVMDYASADTL